VLADAGMPARLFTGVHPHPTTDDLTAGAAAVTAASAAASAAAVTATLKASAPTTRAAPHARRALSPAPLRTRAPRPQPCGSRWWRWAVDRQ
jgi:hypothetical protein